MVKLNRFNGWVAVLTFSCVVLGALIQDPDINIERDSNDKYVISCGSIAIGLSFFAIVGYLFTENLVGGVIEASMGTIVCALWCGAIALVMNPGNRLAIQELGRSHVIRNTNLYFFTWSSFLSSAYVLTSIAQQYRLADVQKAPINLVRWYLLLISSVVVFGTGSKLKPLTCSESIFGFDEDLCRTTKYAIALGVVSAGLSLIPIFWTHLTKTSLIIDSIVGIVVTVFYCVGAAYITDVTGPGSNIGNLYFSVWFGFGLSILLTFSSIKEMICPEPTGEETSQHPDVSKSGEVQEEGEQGPGKEAQRGGEEQLEEIDVEGRDENA